MSDEGKPPPYDIGRADAIYLAAMLKGETSLPRRTNAELVNLLRQTLLLSKSIGENCREWLELCAIIHGDVHPYQAEKLNIPTVEGALAAAIVIPGVSCEGMCATCAFRVGSPANQTENTAEDIMGCLDDGEPFYCHDVEDPAQSKKPCRGFIAAKKLQAKQEVPA